MNKTIKVIIGIGVIWLPVACSSSRTDEQYVEKAQTYLEKGKLNAASIELKNALQQNQNNAQAHWLLGKLYLEEGNIAGAEKELRRASEFGVEDGAVLPLLARVFLAQGKFDALQMLSLEKLTTKKQKAEILAAQGLGELAQREMDGAVDKIDQAVFLDAESAYVGVARARLLVTKKKHDLARKELDRVLELNANYAPAWGLLGDLENLDKNLVKAEIVYTKAIESHADNPFFLLKRALVRIQQKRYEAAQKDIDAMKKRYPQNPDVNFAQGMIYYLNNQLLDAKDAFGLTLQTNIHHQKAMYLLSLTHLKLGNWELAQNYGNQFLSAAPDSISGRKLMALINLRNRDYAAVEELIRPVLGLQEDDIEALNLLGNALLKEKKEEGVELLEKSASLQPDSAIAQLRLGASLLASGKQLKGIGYIEKAIKIDPKLQQAYVLLIQNYIYQKEFDKALKVAEAYRDHHPNKVAPYNLIGRIQLVSGQDMDATEAFTRAREISPGNPVASHGLAALAIKKQAYQEARRYYQDVLKYNENHLSTLLKLATLDRIEKKGQAMLEHLQQAATAHPKVVLPKLALARYYLTQGSSAKVPALMLELSDTQKRLPAVLEVMALSQLAQKQFSEAKNSLERLVEEQPNSAQFHFLLSQAYGGLKDISGMRKELETAIALAPGYIAAHLAYSRLLVLEGQKEKVKEQLGILNKLSPDHPDVLRLKAYLARVQGDQEMASALLEDVFENSPSTASMLSVSRQKWVMGDQRAVLELQERWTAEHPDDLTASLALAAVYGQQDQVEQAISQYKEVLEKDEQNVAALNDLAWYLRNKQPAKALEYAKRASRLAPESAAVMDTLAVVLLKNGEIERAKRKIESALEKNPKNSAFRYHHAMIDAAAGDKASAIKKLQDLLGEGSDFFEKAEAQQLLAELQAGG